MAFRIIGGLFRSVVPGFRPAVIKPVPPRLFITDLPRIMPRWRYGFDGRIFTVEAPTKSEARAGFKRLLGLKRLPAGTSPTKAN